MITIGIDPHKSSHTAVAVDAAGHQLAQRRFVVNAGTVRQLMGWCERWPERRFAVEGAKGLGRSLAQQLASVGEQLVDVPSTLSARARLLATGGDRKTDAADALHVAQVALFRHDLRKVEPEDQSTILRLLTERHDDYYLRKIAEGKTPAEARRGPQTTPVERRLPHPQTRPPQGSPCCRLTHRGTHQFREVSHVAEGRRQQRPRSGSPALPGVPALPRRTRRSHARGSSATSAGRAHGGLSFGRAQPIIGGGSPAVDGDLVLLGGLGRGYGP